MVVMDMHWLVPRPVLVPQDVVSYLFVTETDALRLSDYTLYFINPFFTVTRGESNPS